MKSTVKAAAKVVKELNQLNENNGTQRRRWRRRWHTANKRTITRVLKEKWENKVLHGQYITSRDRQLIGEEDTLPWLSSGDLRGETESEVTAAQDQAFQTKHQTTKILKTETDSKCRLCK
jgi:hypothetical protein